MRREYRCPEAKRPEDVPQLAELQAESKGKTRITIMLDNEVLESFRGQAEKEGLGYQTLINQALRSCIGSRPLDEQTLRKIIREEMSASR